MKTFKVSKRALTLSNPELAFKRFFIKFKYQNKKTRRNSVTLGC